MLVKGWFCEARGAFMRLSLNYESKNLNKIPPTAVLRRLMQYSWISSLALKAKHSRNAFRQSFFHSWAFMWQKIWRVTTAIRLKKSLMFTILADTQKNIYLNEHYWSMNQTTISKMNRKWQTTVNNIKLETARLRLQIQNATFKTYCKIFNTYS